MGKTLGVIGSVGNKTDDAHAPSRFFVVGNILCEPSPVAVRLAGDSGLEIAITGKPDCYGSV
jgi:hypothetical protein